MDREALARDFRELVTQHKALGARLETLARLLDQEAAVEGSSGLACPYEEIIQEWNSRCGAVGMKRRNTPGELRARILGCWRKRPNLDLWRAAFDACARDSWWNGQRGGWRGTLESFVVPKHFDRFMDEAVGAAASPDPGAGPLFHEQPPESGGPEPERVQGFIDRFLSDPRAELPAGFDGMDPRPCRSIDPKEYGLRMAALRLYLENDWRFA